MNRCIVGFHPNERRDWVADLECGHGQHVSHQRGLPFRDGRVRFFTESFSVSPGLIHEYVTGTIFTALGVLRLSHQGSIIRMIDDPVKRQ